MANFEHVIQSVRTALTGLVKNIQDTYGFAVPEKVWLSGCQVVLKSGARAGQLCGKTLKSGSSTCAAHTKSTGTTAPTAPSPAGPVVKEQACFRKSKFNNFTCEGLVIDRITKGVYGRERDDGTIVPLTADDRKRCITLGLQITEKGSDKVKVEEVKSEVKVVEVPKEEKKVEKVEKVEEKEEVVEEDGVVEEEEVVEEDDEEELVL